MKRVIRLEAKDGKLFDSEKKCICYEEHLRKVTDLIRWIMPINDKGCSFANGGGFIRLSLETIRKFDREAEKIIRKYDGKNCADRYVKCPKGFVGRILDDGDSLSYRLWSIRRAISDDTQRLYGQFYYATHELETKDKCWATVLN